MSGWPFSQWIKEKTGRKSRWFRLPPIDTEQAVPEREGTLQPIQSQFYQRPTLYGQRRGYFWPPFQFIPKKPIRVPENKVTGRRIPLFSPQRVASLQAINDIIERLNAVFDPKFVDLTENIAKQLPKIDDAIERECFNRMLQKWEEEKSKIEEESSLIENRANSVETSDKEVKELILVASYLEVKWNKLTRQYYLLHTYIRSLNAYCSIRHWYLVKPFQRLASRPLRFPCRELLFIKELRLYLINVWNFSNFLYEEVMSDWKQVDAGLQDIPVIPEELVEAHKRLKSEIRRLNSRSNKTDEFMEKHNQIKAMIQRNRTYEAHITTVETLLEIFQSIEQLYSFASFMFEVNNSRKHSFVREKLGYVPTSQYPNQEPQEINEARFEEILPHYDQYRRDYWLPDRWQGKAIDDFIIPL